MRGKEKGRHPETESIANKSYKELKVWGEQKQHVRGRVEGMEGEDTHRKYISYSAEATTTKTSYY